ncbi:hypothetical protein K490DRAFT_73663 [Saccharata proteae CBS 121410]|uniref:Membrane anchor Opy2 N-terminal domain-containing protein n=1 Tax=Saccharata proteae CBS 121410 TaxID=1314787 RepID=A0A9P4HVV4_9PEZI|nr:hypothetical protein K490DRAFT_73663 [Saccharata proteae CBS 121410]
MRTIFRRCVQCPNTTPSCPSCGENEYCSQILSSCSSCASAVCVNMNGTPVTADSGSHTNVGAIAGGVVGGVAAIIIITFIIWKFCLKGRRQQYQENWDEMDAPAEKGNTDFTMRRDARASTHTVASLASTVMTRASNIIQIAYIPGITNRSGPQSPNHLIPPVPPIPSALSNQQARTPYSDNDNGEVFFVPGDLRGSTYSGSTGYTGDGRSSYARTSISPSLARGSVASTIYRNNAIVSPLPAQTIVRGKAAVVSVKSSNSGSPSETPSSETPPVPQIDFQKLESQGGLSPSNSVRSVQTVGKPTALNITKKKKTSPQSSLANEVSAAAATTTTLSSAQYFPDRIPISMRPLTEISITDEHGQHSHMDMDSSDSEDEAGPARRSTRQSHAQSPFLDSPNGGLSTVIEEATKRASKDVKSGLGRQRGTSPFDDAHALKE